MFDIGWTELLVVATVAIIVVGPKDLPRMLRTLGRTMGQVRRMSNEFRRQFDDALRDAERSAGLDETRKDIQAMAKANPLKDIQKDLDKTVSSATDLKPKSEADGSAEPEAKSPAKPATPSSPAKPKPVAAPVAVEAPPPGPADRTLHEAEPLKVGATSKQGSDAA